jgi:hypothetical protein
MRPCEHSHGSLPNDIRLTLSLLAAITASCGARSVVRSESVHVGLVESQEAFDMHMRTVTGYTQALDYRDKEEYAGTR